MKTKLTILTLSIVLSLSACNTKKADQQNADQMHHSSDTSLVDTTAKDSIRSSTADSITNAPADAAY